MYLAYFSLVFSRVLHLWKMVSPYCCCIILKMNMIQDKTNCSLKNMIQDKTNCSFESIQHTDSTNLNILKIKTSF